MPDFQEPSGEALRQQQELMRAYESMMLHGMPFRAVDPARQSAETTAMFFYPVRHSRSLQHWEVRLGQSGYCQIDGCSALTFSLVEFRSGHGTVVIKFTVPLHRLREAAGRTHLSLWDGEIFGEVLEWRQRFDEDSIDFTLYLHLEGFEAKSQPGEAVQYTFTVPTDRYQRGDIDAFRFRLERAGLLPDRIEALRELTQERSPVWASPVSQPSVKQPDICRGCRNLHGQYHGGTLLICAMHPYGNGENCSDFEAK